LDVNGLFLSSGVARDPDYETSRMIDAVKLVRQDFGFKGYIHFKVLPGVSRHLIVEASKYADRMSINVEAPNKSILSQYSTCKDFRNDILKRQSWIQSIHPKSGQSTQVVLSNISTDKDILKLMRYEYEYMALKRVYYSSFIPVPGTALENEPAEPKIRESRLYNVDFLIRLYGYKYKEFLQIMDDEMLPRTDPKLALAKFSFERPLDINESSYGDLIRIPGIGPKTASAILARCKNGKIDSYAQLDALGATVERAKPFISLNGMRQSSLGEFSG
jgi:predicted DNA-binding helix-hairpin-helix protein